MEISQSDLFQLAKRRFISQSEISFEVEILHELQISRDSFLKQNGIEEKYCFFWGPESCFSQWFPSRFVGESIIWDKKSFLLGLLPENIEFTSAEQYMIYHKAILFLDRESALKILSSNNPKIQREIGRKVQNFDQNTWNFYRSAIVYWGNEKKFTQSFELRAQLYSTSGTTLVEASPYDRLWGIGEKKDSPNATNRLTWLGQNLLGELLTALRVRLMGHY